MGEKFQDKNSSWAERLEALDQVPGESGFDRTAAWEQLQARLDHAPAGKSGFPYWKVVAAVILLALGFYWRQEKKTESGNIADTPALAPQPTNQLSPLPPAPIQATAARKYSKKTVRPTPAGRLEKLLPAQVPETAAPSVSTPPVSVPGNPAEEPLAAVPIPKKLNQVHLNDLPGEQVNLANDARKPYPRRMIRRLNNLNEESLVNSVPSQFRINLNTPN